MEFFMKLPRSKKEFALFLMVLSILSVNIIAPLITCFELGFHLWVWGKALQVIPFIWPCVIALVLLTYRPAAFLTSKIIDEKDSFGAHMVVNTLCTVFLMSLVLTVLGTWIGSRQVDWNILGILATKWPRNFAISLLVEALVAQPIARQIMLRMHQYRDRRTVTE